LVLQIFFGKLSSFANRYMGGLSHEEINTTDYKYNHKVQ